MAESTYVSLSPSKKSTRNYCGSFFTFIGIVLSTALIVTLILGFVLPQRTARQDDIPPPPSYKEYAKMARYIIHYVDWVALATESTHDTIEKYPFNNVFSMSDGTRHNSSGVPYFYLTDMELSVKDLRANPKTTITASLAQSGYCTKQQLDPEDPRCAHVILTGEIIRIPFDSPEATVAKTALFTRHPAMQDWPSDHNWFFARLDIKHIYLLDYFGGAKIISPEQYYAAKL